MRVQHIHLCLVLPLAGATALAAAEKPLPILNTVFTATNHEGTVFKDAKVLSIASNHVLVGTATGPGILFFTNLPSVISAELAGLAAAQRLNTPDQPRSNRRAFYQKMLDALQGKTDEEKIMAFGPIVDFCVKEMKKLNQEMSETEATGKQALETEEKKAKFATDAAAAERDLETAKLEQAFQSRKITAQQRDEQLLAVKTKYLESEEKGRKDLTAAKSRIWNSVITLGKEQKAAYDELVDVLKQVQKEQEAIAKRLQGGAPAP